ncbi:DegT/DnrJ/EryC1/StrS family aminotransferase [Desulfonatronovibrio magnus]|uniref:DegT/DnrJ/EryC1/StrS aminotransferase family protein n=1 Tax=Desulfonatronovibrio magnus TaxID=698827 RepID=UPI0005EB1477|nr:DegT/DnrJ/EryC1/StrS family aminotransferase [Desulfonatronovibrio magnus]
MINRIPWWRTTFGEEEIEHVAASMRRECVSQGPITVEFENQLGRALEVKHVIATSSGSAALLMALMGLGITVGDEVILPNRTWIATAHAVHLLGAKVVLVDVEPHRPIMDTSLIENAITSRTKAIIPVHMNGRSADMQHIQTIARKHQLHVVEDAAQAFGSRNGDGYLGTQSDIGCFSLSVAKTIATGQGGFCVTQNPDIAQRLRAIRTHGVENVTAPNQWTMPGFNFRFTDVLASIGIEQLKRLPEKIERLLTIYAMYEEGLKRSCFQIIPVNIDAGEIPVYNEFLVNDRQFWIKKLDKQGIETRPFYPDINTAHYFNTSHSKFKNSKNFSNNGIYLPSGPSQQDDNIEMVLKCIKTTSSQ